MKKTIHILLTMSCLVALIFFGCRKKEATAVDNETQSAVDNAVADQEFAGVVPTVNNHAINTKGTGAQSGKTAAVPCDALTQISGDTLALGTTNYSAYPVYTLDVSTCTLSMPDGKALRSGILKITLTDKIKNAGAKMYIKMINFKTGTINYNCDSIVVTTISSNTLFTSFNVKLIKGVCQSPNWTIKYESDRTTTHYQKGNPSGSDPVSEIYGTANGTNRMGLKFSVVIPQATPLVKHKTCQYIDKGVIELTPENFKTRIIDFGQGTCDDDATFTVNGNTVAFKLK
jgi:hypothetical protein